MKEQVFGFRKKEGTVSIYREADMKKFIASLEDGEYEYVLRKKKKIRSGKQNSFYWAICVPMVLEGLVEVGYRRSELSTEVVHDYLKDLFLKFDVVNEDTGDFLTIKKDSKDLSTVEFKDYIAEIQMWAIENLSINIPSPGEQGEMDI